MPKHARGNQKAVDVDPANAGMRREPELPEHEEIVRSERPADAEFAVLDDDPKIDAARRGCCARSMRGLARQAAMDPADGIEM